MDFDLTTFFHLVSVIGFIKSTWLPCCILIKNSFCVPLKNPENCFQSQEITGVQWRAMGTMCLPQPLVSGTVSRAESPPLVGSILTVVARWGAVWGAPMCHPHEGFREVPPSKPSVSRGSREAAAASAANTRCSQQYVLREKGMAPWASAKRFAKWGKF